MSKDPVLEPRSVKSSAEELIGRATSRAPLKTADSLSGSSFERVVIDGESYILKYLHLDDDWIQRVQGDLWTRPLLMWRSGLFDVIPAVFDHTIVDVAAGLGRNGWGTAILMRDIEPWLVPVADGLIPLPQHLRFIDHMAELHARFWGFEDKIGLMPMGNRYHMLGPLMASIEAERGGTEPVPKMVPGGWERMGEESPALAKIVMPLLEAPWPLIEAQELGPQTLVHSDWKAGNLGSLPDGRTVLIDWAFPGRAPPPTDLAWYLAVNNELLPHTKEDAIEVYRDALQRRGVEVSGWWEPALELALLGACLQLAWSKTGAELAWWEDRAQRAVPHLRT